MLDCFPMVPNPEIPFREHEPALEALTGFGRQLLDVATGHQDSPLAEGAEQLVFRHPDGICFTTINPELLQLFIEANTPFYNFSRILQNWHNTGGLVQSAHLWWHSAASRHEVFGQIRGAQAEGDDQYALQCKATMERQQEAMHATSANVQLGALDEFGNFKNGLSIAFDPDCLNTPTDSQANKYLSYLVTEIRSTFTYAEILAGGSIRTYRYPIVS